MGSLRDEENFSRNAGGGEGVLCTSQRKIVLLV